jgi:hypothetical protein
MIKFPRKKIRAGISSSDIISAYQKAFGMSWWQSLLAMFQGVFKLADQTYQETDDNLIWEILKQDKTDLEKYKAEDFDCDDFAFRLMGVFHQNLRTAAMPIFIAWVGLPDGYGHAVISYYCSGFVHIIEPQNDDIYVVPSNWSLLLLCG